MRQKRPPRVLGGLHSEFWEYCTSGEFRLQRCDDCSHCIWPPAPLCDSCLSRNLRWQKMSGLGTVVSHCTFERRYYEECDVPWPVLLVELEEGPLFVSNPVDLPDDELRAGLPVTLRFIDCEDENGPFALPAFEAARTGARAGS